MSNLFVAQATRSAWRRPTSIMLLRRKSHALKSVTSLTSRSDAFFTYRKAFFLNIRPSDFRFSRVILVQYSVIQFT